MVLVTSCLEAIGAACELTCNQAPKTTSLATLVLRHTFTSKCQNRTPNNPSSNATAALVSPICSSNCQIRTSPSPNHPCNVAHTRGSSPKGGGAMWNPKNKSYSAGQNITLPINSIRHHSFKRISRTNKTPFDTVLFFITVSLFFMYLFLVPSADAAIAASDRSQPMRCESMPCKQNQKCIPLRSGYRCECNEGYVEQGSQCVLPEEKPCDPIDADHCMHNGTCTMRLIFGTEYMRACNCDPSSNYIGPKCEKINPAKLFSNGTITFRSQEIRNAGLLVGVVVLGFAIILTTTGRLRCWLRNLALEEINSKNGIFYTTKQGANAMNVDSYSNSDNAHRQISRLETAPSRYMRSTTHQPQFVPLIDRGQSGQSKAAPAISTVTTTTAAALGSSDDKNTTQASLHSRPIPLSAFVYPQHIPQTSYTNFQSSAETAT